MDIFQFKQFVVRHHPAVMKVGTDGVLLGAVAKYAQPELILDIGTGSGIIAMMLAQNHPQASVHAVDISTAAIELAVLNFKACPFSHRLLALCTGISEYAASTSLVYDLIVSNPPFFTGGNFSPEEQKNVMRQTFKLSHQDLLRSVHKLLSPQGEFCIILPHLEGLRFIEMARFYNLHHHFILKVTGRESKPVERLVLKFSRAKQSAIVENSLIIHSAQGNGYSEEYVALTKDFYSFMPD